MFTKNQLKSLTKRALPKFLLDPIQAFRAKRYERPAWLTECKTRHEKLNAGLPAGEFVFREGLKVNIDPRAREGFEWFCFRSPDMVLEYDLFHKLAEGKKKFLDVGACHGVYSLAFTANHPDRESLAVDPSPMAFEVLQENFRLNPTQRMRAVHVAAGDKPSSIWMRKIWHHLEAVSEHERKDGDLHIEVKPVDAILAETGYEPDLIKFDVEGFELQAIQGAEQYLRRRPVDLLIEIHPDRIRELKYSLNDLTGKLMELGYHFYEAKDGGREMSQAEVDDRIHTNWIVCRHG